ncbi:MAG: RecQ family ATP-dependent DNA helicase [Verrucomicrobia bacterium]|nr:RecQ family ATP-dependent DNA helicase [Verrucomicrobiota bacterium]
MTTFDSERADELLRLGLERADVAFREGQREAIAHVVEGRGRLLLVQKTGWGKSSVYFIAAKLLCEAGMGPALLISPLLALMRNQIAAAERMGVRAATINSDNTEDWEKVEARMVRGEVDILLVSPERQANEQFCNHVLGPMAGRVSLLVIDEAHCISDWGHDFRPHYRLIERMLRALPANVRLLATTATANDRVVADLQVVLGPNLTVSRGDLSRSSLFLQTIRLPGQASRLAWLAKNIRCLEGSGIVYTLTVRDAEQVAGWLKQNGIVARAYTGQSGDERPTLEQALLDNRLKVLVATTALGMGFDKPDLSFVIHYQSPGSVVAYYQHVGRAGRALSAAYGVLLSGEEETEINDYFINTAFPSRAEVGAVIDSLKAAENGLSVSALMEKVNVSFGRIQKTLLLLSLESPAPVVKHDRRWKLTPGKLTDAFWQRAERLTGLRRAEQKQMQNYVALADGHMEFLIRALDGDPGQYKKPDLPPLSVATAPALEQQAATFLKRTHCVIEPRRRWPSGGLAGLEMSGTIAEENRARPGRALCLWGDAGWGKMVSTGKYRDGHFPDELAKAASALVREWQPWPAPEWVTCIPSPRHPKLVPDLASRLARILNLPFQQVLEWRGEPPEQKTMANSSQQAGNVAGSLAFAGRAIPSGPVLLIDDVVDSRWTMTVAAHLLAANGGGAVFPLALAATINSG